jgi:hypothetical protein
MDRDHFIVIVYYFGTVNLTGSRRWREMAQLLRLHGKVTVVCEDGGSEGCDGIEIIEVPDVLKGRVPSVFSGRSNSAPLVRWLRHLASSLLFWPDRQQAWSKQAVARLDSLLARNHRNIVITSGPIFSVHSEMQNWVVTNPLRALWVMDFRDLWTNEIAPGLQRRTPGFLTRFEQRIEQRCHGTADLVTTAGEGLAKLIGKDFGSCPIVLYNGYISKATCEEPVAGNPVSVRYLGTIIPGLRSPKLLFQAAAEMQLTSAEICFEFWCNDSARIIREAATTGVADLVKCHGAVSQSEARKLSETAGANIILNALVPESDQVVTGKVFELIAMSRPVLSVTGQASELRKILESCGMPNCIWDRKTASLALKALLSGHLTPPNDSDGRFSRQRAVSTFCKALEGLPKAKS